MQNKIDILIQNERKSIKLPRNCIMLNSKLKFQNLLQKLDNSICFDISFLFSFDGLSLSNKETICDCCQNVTCLTNSNGAITKMGRLCPEDYLLKEQFCPFIDQDCQRKENPEYQTLKRMKRDTTSPCSPNPCLNNGVCSISGTTYQCQCTSAFTGSTCSVDVNECLLNICQFATGCSNTYGSYICSCISGFLGVNCDTMINTCSPSPCQNNAMCYGMLNDYDCLSSLTVNTFAGKNSTLPLTGCNGPNLCPSNMQCIPVFNGTHTYQCACQPGLTGSGCTTNITYTLHSGMNYKKSITERSDLNVSFALKTISPSGLLLVFVFTNMNYNVGLDVLNHGIRITATNTTRIIIPYGTVTTDPSQYVPYRVIMLLRVVSGNNVFCVYVRVGTLPQGYYCSLLSVNSISGNLYLNQQSDLQTNAGLSLSFGQIRDMEACIIDYMVNSNVDILTTYNAGGACVGPLNLCSATSCFLNINRGSQCINYWLSQLCICNRPFYGPNCEFEIANLTLSTGSYMQMAYPIQYQQNLQTIFQLSFFFMTSSTNAIIFYIGSFFDPNNPNNALFLSGELVNGYINIKNKLSGSSTVENLAFSTSLSWKLNDGLSRLIFITVQNNIVTVNITQFGTSRNVIALTLTNTISFVNNFSPALIGSLAQIDIISFGSPSASAFALPSSSAGNSQTISISSSLPSGAFSFTSSFIGVVQDIQWNGYQSNIASQSNLPATAFVPIYSQGLVTVNVNLASLCSPNPCQNSAPCTVQNYNQLICTCSPSYFGNLCQYVNLCINAPNCPALTNCIPRSDGYDCTKIFSIIAKNQSVILNVTNPLTPFSSVSLGIRTRAVSSSLVRLISSSLSVILEIDNQGRLVGRYSSAFPAIVPSNVVTAQAINDAVWHTISFTFSPYIQIVVDQMINRATDYGATPMNSIVGIGSVIFGDAQNSLLGCFNQPVIGQYLVITSETFAYNSSLATNGSASTVSLSCTGANVCGPAPCQNNGTCSDNFNQFSCTCTSKFDGATCTIPTCQSIGLCSNNSLAPCAQLCPGNSFCGPGEIRYGCVCVPGWVGLTCAMVNPCIFGTNTAALNPPVLPAIPFNPCLNNGTCSYTVNDSAFTASFSCQCISPWTGQMCITQVTQYAAVVAGIVVGVVVFVLLILTIVWVAKVYHDQKHSGSFLPEEPLESDVNDPPPERII